ncbi:hypothetical protein MAIC_51090 [Mycolicibacterium aichiense]|uniref:Uncharacterized protein n=1 Tax=Mycolicibacterium aichiense TaxID=1799 RepID=A0AAD1MEU9_9MYCO|nr:hypothetical protein MAIC_51090 [Mycolicibacterium aichiense]
MVSVTVVVGVEYSVSDGMTTSLEVSDGDVEIEDAEPGFRSVVETRVDVVRDVVDVFLVEDVVVLIAGAYVTGPSGRCELSEVSSTAYTSIASSTNAATPET